MKCFASPLDVCHNILRCTSLGAGKCAYEKELLNIPIETSTKMPLNIILFFKDGKEVGRIEGIEMEELKEVHHFRSGASSSGKLPPYECLTIDFLKRSAERMRLGMHYGKHNWKKGSNDKQFILDRLNNAMEHLIKATSEIDNDVLMTDDDLAAVVVNCMFAMEYQKSQV